MSQCIVPSWDVKRDHQGDQSNQNNLIPSAHHHLVPMSDNYEVQELTWENGQIAMHGLNGLINSGPTTKPTWGRAGDTLESIVHQATCHPIIARSTDAPVPPSSERKWTADHHLMKKRPRSDHSTSRNDDEQQILMDGSGCGSANATFCRNNNNSLTRTWVTNNSMDSLKMKKADEDSTMMTWPSFESPATFKTKATTTYEDSTFHHGSENQDDGDGETKAETLRSHSSRRTRAAAIHNQSERRRRDRINQKMKSLQKLVPNASKTDKASMLDEVIEYLKQLQAQVQMIANMRNLNVAQMMGMQQQQQLQMSLLSRMGMGMGMGVLPPQYLPPHTLNPPPLPSFIPPPPFMLPPPFIPPTHAPAPPSPETASRTNGAGSMADPCSAFLAQSMNVDLYNKMVAIYRQQQVAAQATGCSSKSNQVQGD